MAYTQAQEAALQRARARLSGTEDEDKTSSLVERQWQAIQNARATLNPGEPTPTSEVGFMQGLGNATMRGLSNLRSIPDAFAAEEFSKLADAADAQAAREAERARTGEEPGMLERIATWRPSWAAPLESASELRGLAADNAQAVAQRSVDAQENYPMTQAGAQAVQELSEADGFIDGLGTVLSNPLATASGVAQVAAEQIPTIAGAAATTALTKNPKLGVGLFAGSGYSQERFGQLVPEASKQGYNLLDRGDAIDAVSDTEFMQDQATRGQTRGAIIGAVDLVTAGLASKAPLTLGSATKQAFIQVAGGGGGEAAAQLATDGEIQAGEVIIEALAEGVSAPADIAALGLRRPSPQGTEINSEEAQLLAEEELQLQAAQLAEQEEAARVEKAEQEVAAAQAQADLETTSRIRRDAAQTFTPRKEFVAARTKELTASLESDIRNPSTEIGTAFDADLNAKGVFDPADVDREAKAFLKSYQKTVKADTDAQLDQEYVAALDNHVVKVAETRALVEQNPELMTVDAAELNIPDAEVLGVLTRMREAEAAKPKPQGDTATDAAPQETVAKPAKPPTKKEQLRALAVEQLGENFEQDNPELSQLLSDGKGIYPSKGKPSKFEKMLNAAVKEKAALAPVEANAPVDAQAVPETTQEDVAAPTVVAEDAPAAKGPTTDVAAIFTQDLPSDVKLSKNEQAVFDTMRDAFANNEQDDIVQADGKLNPQRIADRGGMKSRQAAQTALTRLRPKLAKAYGLSQEQIKQRLAETKNKAIPGEAFDINAADTEVDLAELGDSMGTVASANQGARDGMDDADIAYMEARSQEPDQYASKRQEIADKERNNQLVGMVKTHGKDAIAAWKNGVSVGGPKIDQLGKADLLEWISAVEEHKEGSIDDAQLAQDLRDIETKYDQNNAGPTLEDTNAGQTIEGTATENDNDAPTSTGDTPSTSSGNQAEQVGTTNTGESGRSSQVKVEVKKRKKITRPKFSLDEAKAGATGTTAGNVRDAVEWLIGEDVNWRVNVINSPDQLIGMVLSKEVNIDGLTLGGILDRSNARGVVVEDRDGVTQAFFFSDNITPGTERGAVIHELGSHLGMDNVLTREQLTTATNKIREWASTQGTSLEKTIAQRALERVSSAEAQNAVADNDSETLAYFLEEAVNAGVTPNSDSKSSLVQFVRQIWADFKAALRKLRPANEAALSAQDLVNMARGSARLELATDFHGSTAAFRTANPDYFGLGNNAVGVGFYISEDIAVGGQYMMERMKQRTSMGGALQRVDTTVAENEYLNWDAPLAEQPAMVEAFGRLPEEIQTALLQDSRLDSVEKLNGRQFYLGLTQLQLRDQTLQDYVSDAEFARSDKLERGTTKAMSVASAFLDANGVKGIKTQIKTTSSNPNPMFNKIIFNDKNVVVVGRNDAADVDTNTTTPGTIKFSVPESETNNQVSWLRKNVSPAAGEAASNLTTAVKAPYTATKNLDRVIRDNEAKLPSARKWMNFMLDAEATRNRILGMVEGVVNQTRQFNMERKELVNDFLGTSTFFQKWGYDPEWTDADGNKVEVKIDPIMKKKYDRLTAEEQQVVRDVFSHGRKLQLMMQDVAKDMGVSKFFKFDSKLEGPYAPLKRFGDYVGELKSQALLDAEAAVKESPTDKNRKKLEELKSDGDNYVISFFKSFGEAETFTEANKDKFAYAVPSDKLIDFDESRPGGAQAYEKIMGAVNANMAGLDQSSKDAMAKMVRDMYFQTLDQSNARLSGARRLNRAGYDKDMIRSFAAHGMAQSNLLAQMKHGGDISSALLGIKQEAKTNPTALNPIYNQIAAKFRKTMTPRTGMLANAEDALMKFNSFYMLTSSLGYFVQNMTQPYFAVANIADVTGVSGQPAVWGKLLGGYGVAKKVINTSFLNQIKNVASVGLLGKNSTVELNIDNAPPELRPLLKQLQDRGLLDVGITEDLRSMSAERGNIAARGYEEMTHRLYQSARYVEANNRIASAVAAFRTAQKNPAKMKRLKMTPQEFALRIVQDTQGNFSSLDAPALFDALPKAPLQFRKYQFQMAFLHIDAAKQAFKGADAETKKAGKAKLSLMLGYTGLFGGLASVPMAGVATSAVQAALSWFDPEDDDELNPDKTLERWIRENVDDERTATLLSRGLPAALGWDFSQKLDQADLFMPYNSKYVQMDPSRDGTLLFAAQLMLGPTGTMVGNAGNVLDFLDRGNLYRAGEYMMPKGLRSYFETMRYAQEGYKTRSDLTVADPTSFDLVDILTNAVGLPSTDINQIKWTRGQQVEIEQWFSSETTRITRGYRSAREDRDRKTQTKYREEFRELQRSKDRVRPFFNGSRRVLQRQSLGQLLRSSRRDRSDQRRLDSITGR